MENENNKSGKIREVESRCIHSFTISRRSLLFHPNSYEKEETVGEVESFHILEEHLLIIASDRFNLCGITS